MGGVNFPFGVHATGVVVPHVYAAHPLVYGKRDADAQLVHHPNGAITPHDPNLAAATAAHLATKGYGVYGYPYHYGVYGKREADAQLVHHANGAITPYDPNLAIATNAHLATRFGYYGHPYVYGKKEAQIPVGLVTGYSAVHAGYPFHYGYGVAPVVSPFVAHPNGALVPAEPKDVVDARAEHLAAHAVEKREAQIPVGLVTGYSAVHAGYPFHYGYGVAPVVSPFVAHPNGALVPAEPKDVV